MPLLTSVHLSQSVQLSNSIDLPLSVAKLSVSDKWAQGNRNRERKKTNVQQGTNQRDKKVKWLKQTSQKDKEVLDIFICEIAKKKTVA